MNRFSFLILLAHPALADTDLPDFATCIDREIARYERELTHHRTTPDAQKFEVGDVRGVDYCGSVGITLCDRSANPVGCQHAFRGRQDRLNDTIRATLPTPDSLTGVNGQWSDTLYPLTHALAFGSSAGADCAGDTEVMEAWCAAREANRRLSTSILAWQLARFLDATPDAITAGWARPVPPTRPRARPVQTR
ncbi:MAG: hypothetical protein N4A53_14195 [Pelagimonas sp.]|jgi:hypothetical protein|nr:hypothetical protein [Pelagimonas sp.]